MTPRTDTSTFGKVRTQKRIGSMAGGAVRLTPAVLMLDIETHGR